MEIETRSILSPELLGPIFKTENITLRQALYDNNSNRKLRLLSTFVPDELILLIDAQTKLVNHNLVILLLQDISSLYGLFDKFFNCQNNGSSGLSYIFNLCTSVIVEQIYMNGGDVIQLSDSGILSMWRQNTLESMNEIMKKVITISFDIKENLKALETNYFDVSEVPIRSAVSVGSLTFVSIGNGSVRHYVASGESYHAVVEAIKLFHDTTDLIITKSARDFCNLTDYAYTYEDDDHIKITREVNVQRSPKTDAYKNNVELICKSRTDEKKLKSLMRKYNYYQEISKAIAALKTSPLDMLKKRKCLAVYRNRDTEERIVTNRHDVLNSCVNDITETLKTYIILPALEQIEQEKPLDYLSEMKMLTVVMMRVTTSSTIDLISLTDNCHAVVSKACGDVGCIENVSLCESSVVFRVVFGIRTYLKNYSHCYFGLNCAWTMLNVIKRRRDVNDVFIGVSTGMACCMAVGHVMRRHYALIGSPIIKAELIMRVSHDKVTCDHDTLIYSGINKVNFPSYGLIDKEGCQLGYVFVYSDQTKVKFRILQNQRKVYPILGRFEELESFSVIMDDIGMHDRHYAGIVIEGANREGKSRLLDSFEISAKARQLYVIKLALHPSFSAKPYSIIHKILKQILETEDCRTVAEFERDIVGKLSGVVLVNDLCYLNKILRVQFRFSEQYVMDSDWERHYKTISIFDKILKLKNRKMCVLIDNLQYMDYMSWQFLSRALTNDNVVIAMTILALESSQRLSRVEQDIYKNKKLLRCTLPEMDSEHLPTLVCQFLNVQAFSSKINDFLMKLETKNPGWLEQFLNLMTAYQAFNVVYVTLSEALNHQLTFPTSSLLNTRIDPDLFPEEVAPVEPWNKKNKLAICLVNAEFDIADSYRNFDTIGIMLEIFSKLSDYEQEIVQCASVLGQVFVRSMLDKLIRNQQPDDVLKAIEKLMQLRIFECASMQRQRTRVGDLNVCSFEPRTSFSDAQHLVHCRCQSDFDPPVNKNFAHYAHCRFMEFKVADFRYEIYEKIPESEVKRLHRKIADIYRKEARQCAACGGGSFLWIPGKENLKKEVKQTVPLVRTSESSSVGEQQSNRASSNPRGMQTENDGCDMAKTSGFLVPNSGRKITCVRRIFKQSPHARQADFTDLSYRIRDFGHVDFRNCSCLKIIECIYLRLQQHLSSTYQYRKSVDLDMEYAAALMSYGQPSYALSFLAKADEKNDFASVSSPRRKDIHYRKMINKSMILCLRGNAYMSLGNYPQAKSNYGEALSLYETNFTTNEMLIDFKTSYEKIKQHLLWLFATTKSGAVNISSDNRDSSQEKSNVIRQNAAMSLSLVSSILVLNNYPKAAKLASVQSLTFGFFSFKPSNFHNQCQLYVSFVKNYGKLGHVSFMKRVEKYILFVIRQKTKWSNSEDYFMLMHVYASILKASLLRGCLGRAVYFGGKALIIAKAFHATRDKYELLVSLIQVLIRLKRVCEAMDMLQQLRDYAIQDIDRSAITWYYALCVDFFLDAGLYVESYQNCSNYARKVLAGKSGYCVTRDTRGFKRLVAGLWTWQLRKVDLTSTIFVKDLDFFMHDLKVDDFSQITTLCKILECHLLLLSRCINMKRGNQMELLLVDINTLIETLNKIAQNVRSIRPHYYLLRAYFSFLNSYTSQRNKYLQQAQKVAESQMNVMTLAWIIRNKITWLAISYNNMARYWEENIGFWNAIFWQDLDTFDLNDWSNVLYSLPIPESYI